MHDSKFSARLPDFAQEHVSDRSEQVELETALEALVGLLQVENPSELAAGRERLLESVARIGQRFLPLFGKLGQLFDLGPEALAEIFTRAEGAHEWQPGPLPWVSLFHLVGGERIAGLDAGLVRLKRGTPFPAHRHTASERVLILEGGYHDDQGRWYGPGDFHDMATDSEHSLQMTPERDTLLAVVLEGEIRVLGL